MSPSPAKPIDRPPTPSRLSSAATVTPSLCPDRPLEAPGPSMASLRLGRRHRRTLKPGQSSTPVVVSLPARSTSSAYFSSNASGPTQRLRPTHEVSSAPGLPTSRLSTRFGRAPCLPRIFVRPGVHSTNPDRCVASPRIRVRSL